MKTKKKKRKESGQAMVEFAFVLPIFLLLVMGIMDFGFLFYNYISLENSARNAARMACVSYENVAVDHSGSSDSYILKRTLELPEAHATQLSAYTGGVFDGYSTDEKKICMEVAKSLSNTGIATAGRTVTISYSYDTSEEVVTDGNWKAKNRYKGDVTVAVRGEAHVLTPVLGVTADHMKKPLGSLAVYKVEEQYQE